MKQGHSYKIPFFAFIAVALITLSTYSVIATPQDHKNIQTPTYNEHNHPIPDKFDFTPEIVARNPSAISVSDANPFYTLIATPLAVFYNELGEQMVTPLYVKNMDDPSKAVERAEAEIGIGVNLIIDDIYSPKEISLTIANLFWEQSAGVLLIEDSQEGYNLGVAATPLASYLNIPVIVSDIIDQEVITVLDDLETQHLFVCGDFNTSGYNATIYSTVDEIIIDTIALIKVNLVSKLII